MPIIINEFEVVTAPPSNPQSSQMGTASGAEGSGAGPATAAPAPSPLDIRRVEEHQQLRLFRLWAH